jgi:hypothetical protein
MKLANEAGCPTLPSIQGRAGTIIKPRPYGAADLERLGPLGSTDSGSNTPLGPL